MATSRQFAQSFGAVAMAALAVGIVVRLSAQAQLPYAPVAKAKCGPGSQPESGMQGLMSGAERFSPALHTRGDKLGEKLAELTGACEAE